MNNVFPYSPELISRIHNTLLSGGVVCFPTETVYALACDATNEIAINKIYHLKKRSPQKALSVLVPNVDQLEKIAELNTQTRTTINKYSPGAVTYILKRKPATALSQLLNNQDDTIGIRIPDHPIALEILARYPHPLIGTSTNLSGEKNATSVAEIDHDLKNSIDLIIDGGKSELGIASTVLDLTNIGEMKIIRQGSVVIF